MSGSSEQWSSFWQQGFVTTFGATKVDNYDGAVRQFWVSRFNDLCKGARILDIATGNGAIATMAAEVSESSGKGFFLAATDLAEISGEIVGSSRASKLRTRIQFHSHAPCERLPFAELSFDLVTSQFGFEYSEAGDALGEIWRVLKPGGHFLAISHHSESPLVQRSHGELAVYDSALQELRLFSALKSCLAAVGDLNVPNAAATLAIERAEPLSRKLNALMDEFASRHSSEECAREIMGSISQLARSARSTSHQELLSRVDATQREFRLARTRLDDMVRAALSKQQIGELCRAANDTGFCDPSSEEFRTEHGQLIGWLIGMKRAGISHSS